MNSILRAHVLCKRGGSSGGSGGGGGGSKEQSKEASPQKSGFGVANNQETKSGIKAWDDEFGQMTEARQGATNKYSKVDPDILEDSAWIANVVADYARNNPERLIGIKDNNGNIQASAVYEKKKRTHLHRLFGYRTLEFYKRSSCYKRSGD